MRMFEIPLPLSPSPDDVDAALRTIAKSQCEIDWIVGEWLIAAEELEVYRRFGCANYCEYVGRIFGWKWRQALQRLNTAKRLRVLPLLSEALSGGRFPWSAIREVARVATPATEATWLKRIQGKTLRQIEPMVAGLEEGDPPGAKKDPRKIVKRVVLEMTLERWERYAAGIGILRTDCDEFLTEEDAVLQALEAKAAERTGDGSRSRNQLLFVRTLDTGETCIASEDGFAVVSEEVAELLDCDSVQVGLPGEGAAGGKAKQTVAPSVRRFCIARAGGRCQVPGCRQIHNLDVHHLVLRKDGGTSEAKNLVVLCSSHHRAFHEGWLLIDGTWETGFRFRHVTGKVYGSADTPSALREANEALQALRRLGFREDDARAALDEARRVLAERQATVSPEALVEEALRAAGRVKRYRLDKARTAAPAPAAHVGSGTSVATAHVKSDAETSAHVGSGKATASGHVANRSPAPAADGRAIPETAHVGNAAPVTRSQAIGAAPIEEAGSALCNLGFRPAELRVLLEEARSTLEGAGGEMTTERLIAAALRVVGRRNLGGDPVPAAPSGLGGASVANEPEATYRIRRPAALPTFFGRPRHSRMRVSRRVRSRSAVTAHVGSPNQWRGAAENGVFRVV